MDGRIEHEMKVSQYIEDRIKDYPEYVSRYNIVMDGEGKSYNTRKSYINTLLRYLIYLRDHGYDISDPVVFRKIKTTDIKIYFASINKIKTEMGTREASGSYINMQQRALGNFFMFLVEDGIIEKSPLRVDGQNVKIKKRKDNHVQIALDPSEIETMYHNISTGVGSKAAKSKQATWKERDLAIIDLGLNSGLRVSALTGINVDDIDFAQGVIRVTEKGDKVQFVEIDGECAKWLRLWLAKRSEILGGKKVDALFISNRRERITQDGVAKIVKKYSAGINKHVTPHKLRSTFVTNAYQATNDIASVSAAVGHGSISMTQRYIAQNERDEKRVVNAVRDRYKNH